MFDTWHNLCSFLFFLVFPLHCAVEKGFEERQLTGLRNACLFQHADTVSRTESGKTKKESRPGSLDYALFLYVLYTRDLLTSPYKRKGQLSWKLRLLS